MKIEGKNIVVFGGTSGIGKSVVDTLANKKAKKIYAISRFPEKFIDPPENVNLVKLDVLNEKELNTFFIKLGNYDALINAATGGERAIGPFKSMELEGFRSSFKKLWGYTNTVRLGLANLSKEGCIILVSGSPARKAKTGQIALSSVGGAVESFSKGLAAEIKPIRINVVSPGIIDTPMSSLKGNERESFYQKITADNLIPRAGSPKEVSSAIIFALENEFITGTVIDVDGGWLAS